MRAARKKPGLRPQHVLSAEAAARISHGRLEGCIEGSKELKYLPGRIEPGRYFFEAGTAGSVSLVFQTLLAPLAFSNGKSSVLLKGGTHVPWSPPADYISEVFLPALNPMGVSADFSISSRGYYPGGGGVVEAVISPASMPLKPFVVQTRGRLLNIRLLSAVSKLPLSIAERQMRSASGLLSEFAGSIMEPELIEAGSAGTGTSVFIIAEFENSRAGFSALGARGKRAEEVGAEAARSFLDFIKTEAFIDPWLSDQMALYMALARGESAFVSVITEHLLTNIHIIEEFLPVKFKVSWPKGGPGTVTVEGAGFE